MKKQNGFFGALCCFFALQMALPVSLLAQLTVSVPTFPTTNTVRLNLTGADTNNAHIIFFTPDLAAPLAGWTRMTTGTVGQTSFDLTKPSKTNAFFAAGIAPIATPTVATPVFSPAGGSYGSPTNVTVTCATAGAAIYYTTNNSTPTPSDNYIFSGGTIYIAGVTTLKAKAFASGYIDSAVATATYTINAAPFVYAGVQQIISSSPTTLEGVVTDDGLTGGGIKSTNWTVVSGPGSVTFTNSHQTNTAVSFDTDGIYVLQLSASDGQYTNSSLVTIAQNPSISVSLTAPADGSVYTVPTNLLLQASAGGSVTQVLLYANSSLIGEATGSPLSFNWKSVPAGTLALKAIAFSSDPNNYSLASSPVTITVNWPTNVGQVAYSSTDLQIPTAGLPIAVNREYNTQLGTGGSFGAKGRLDFEQIRIEKNASLATGWTGRRSGVTYWVEDTSSHLITVSLSDQEKYYFRPIAEFKNGSTYSQTINSAAIPRYQQGNRGRLSFLIVGSSLGSLEISTTPSNVGYDDNNFSGWQNLPVRVVQSVNLNDYNPGFDKFTFTAPDGSKYTFNGDGTVASKTDRNGNSLVYSSSGITWSNPNLGSSKQINFTRDGNNLITEIYDPIAITLASTNPAVMYAYDNNGNLTNMARLIQRAPAVYENTAYAYTNMDFFYHVTAITDPRGVISSRYLYDSSGRLTRQYDALGRYTSYIYDTLHHLQVVTDRLNYSTTQRFTDSGQLASVQDAAGAVTSYGYDSQGRRIAETNALGQVTTFAYDANDNLIATTNEVGSASTATYDNYGDPLSVTDPAGNPASSEYDLNGNLIFAVNALGVTNAYGYDVLGNRIAETNACGLPEESVTTNAYNEFGWLTNTATGPSSTGYTYDENGNRLTETKARTAGAVLTQWQYDAANRLSVTVDALSGTSRIFYNGIGKQSRTEDALNRTNIFIYNLVGLLTNTTFADKSVETQTYDAEGRKVTSTDRNGHTTSYNYDVLGRPTQTTYADNTFSSSSYDSAGRLNRSAQVWVIDNGATPPTTILYATRYAYDAAGRRIAVTNALGQTTRYAYDANGNQTNIIDALSHTNNYFYDVLNRQTKITFADNSAESYGYDGLNRKVAVTNQAGIVSRFGFDILGRLVAVTNAFGTSQQMVTQYAYDEVGNLLQQIDALNHINAYTYDALGRRTKEMMPGSQAQTFACDPAGNLTRLTNFNGVIIANQYDALNRLTNKASTNGYKISFTYSAGGQRTSMTDASGITSYTYDSRDRLVLKITPEGALTNTYDGFGNLATVQSSTASGVSITYRYDALNRLTNVVDRFNNSTIYSFDAAGNLQTVQLPNNVTNSYAYDSLNRLTNLVAKSTNGTVANFTYKLAPAGNRTSLVETVNGTSRTNIWTYDSLYRLTSETIVASIGGMVSNKYDSVGNRTDRTSSVAGITNQTFVFNSNDQPTTDLFDANGNTRTNNGNTFGYDVENRLTNAIVNGTNIIVVYDGDGNRVKKIVGTTTNLYLTDDVNPTGYAQVLEEKTVTASTTNLVRTYTYGLDLISQKDTATAFFGYDGNGNTRYLTTTNSAVTDTYVYDAFGVVITTTGTTTNFYRYSGEQYDPNLGFVYLRSRYVNPNAGRFLSRDSFTGRDRDPQSLHKYTYAENDPVDHTDPNGRDIGAILGVINILSSLSSSSFVGAEVIQLAKTAGVPSLRFASQDTPLGIVERVLAAEVKTPGQSGYDLNDSIIGLIGVSAVIVNRVESPKFPKTITGVIKQKGQFAGFENYPTLPGYITSIVSDLESFANAKGEKVLNYRLHMQNLVSAAQRVVNLDDTLDPFVPADGPYLSTLFFRTAGSSNPWGGPARQKPEYRDTAGGNDFYTDKQ